jgi:hypothetical protein
MDATMHEFLWSGTVTGFLSGLGLVVAAIVLGVVVVRGWAGPGR